MPQYHYSSSSDRIDDTVRFYALLANIRERTGGYRTLSTCDGRMSWPRRGVYFFFEDGEERSTSGHGGRVVRIGTHALKPGSGTSLWNRLSQHRGASDDPCARSRGRCRSDGFTVERFHDLCERMARRSRLTFDAPEGNHPRYRPFWEEETPMLLLSALERLPDERYDAIVVDEGQDFLPDWWLCLDEALARGREGTLYAFYDAHQNIFGGHLPPEALEVNEHRLVFNCRNTTRIAEYAARLIALEPRVKVGAPQGDEVEEIVCRNAEDMVRKVAGRLTRLVDDEGIEPGSIAILSTRTLGNSPFADDHRAGRFDLVSLDAGLRSSRSRDRVVYETLYRYKGLEADVVILLDLPGGSKEVEPRDLYVAATRAKHLLVVMRFDRAP